MPKNNSLKTIFLLAIVTLLLNNTYLIAQTNEQVKIDSLTKLYREAKKFDNKKVLLASF